MKTHILVLAALLIMGCSTENLEIFEQDALVTADAKANIEKGKPNTNGNGNGQRKVMKLTASNETFRIANTNEIGRIMKTPEALPEGFVLPTDDNGGYVDWDNDGEADDLIVITDDCYWPMTKVTISVFLNGTDEHAINYNSRFYTELLGFADVNSDGFMDIILYGGNSNDYNNGEPYSYYNVGYNVEGQYPLPTKDILMGLQPSTQTRNVNYLVWDIREFGYEHYSFHVHLFEGTVFGEGEVMGQIPTYGEHGFPIPFPLTPGQLYTLRFEKMNDNCEYLDVTFVYTE